MSFVSAKCPNCGASIQMDNLRESGFCQYCGSKIQFKESVTKVRIDKTKNLSSYRELAMSAFRGKDYSNALKYTEKALEIDAQDAEMWFLKGRATLDSSYKIVNADLILECVRNAVKYASNKKKISLEANTFLYEAAQNVLTWMDDEDVSSDFWKDIAERLEKASIRFVMEVPEDFTNTDGENARKKYAEYYIEYLKRHMYDDGTHQWILSKKDQFFDLVPGSMSEREERWRELIGNLFTSPEARKNWMKIEGMSKTEACGCLIFLVILNIFLWYYIITTTLPSLYRTLLSI